MNTFVNAVRSQEARTENGMKALQSSANNVVDLFYQIGASRGKDIIPKFVSAFCEDKNLALRVSLWARDIRGGAGERQLFRDILLYLESNNPEVAEMILPKIPELGRWDDLLIFKSKMLKNIAFDMIRTALEEKNGLCAKWMPRKGVLANEIRTYFGWSPKFYRKTIVGLTNVVETQMCKKEWNDINFSHVPSVAHARYKTAFYRNAGDVYVEWVKSLVEKNDPKVKINAGAVYPYDVLKGALYTLRSMNKTEKDVIIEQWAALENFIGDADILPMVDVSGSMTCPVGGNPNLTCLDVALSMGLYCAEKNTGKFKDTFLTFSMNPELLYLKGNVLQKIEQMSRSDWGMNTNIISAFNKILKVAKDGNVPQSEMPKVLLIFSDMQFDSCAKFDDSAIESINRRYTDAGYEVPKIVFWNLNARDNMPVKYNEQGVAMVSGFSPSILKAILSGDMEEFSPYSIMIKTIMSERYDF